MASKTWARLDAAVSTTHPIATVLEVTQPLDAALVPGTHIFAQTLAFVDVTAIAGIAPGWTTKDGTSFAVPLVVFPTSAQLLTRAQRAFQAALAKARTFNVAASGQPATPILCDGTRATRDDLTELAAFGQANAAATRVWLDNAGATTVLTGTQLVTLDALVRAWVSATYAAHATLLAAITATPPSVTTSAQVDAFAWPTA